MGEACWLRAEDGNTLALFPAAVLVMFILASMAIDAAVTFSAQRQLSDIAAAAANDAASAALDTTYYGEGRFGVDRAVAGQRVDDTVGRRTDSDRLAASCIVDDISADGLSVTVVCRGTVTQLISPARFLNITSRDIRATATATAQQG